MKRGCRRRRFCGEGVKANISIRFMFVYAIFKLNWTLLSSDWTLFEAELTLLKSR